MSRKMVNPVGFRFRPTNEEFFDYYLRIKNLESNTNDVDRVISTIDICSVDPWFLPPKSKIKPKDLVWFFFGVKKKIYKRGDQQSRKTKSGFWKKTGKTMEIMRKRGNREKIGEKRVLVFHWNKLLGGSKTEWVMHEYQSLNKRMPYTICKVKFKGEEREMCSYPGNEVEQAHSHEVGQSFDVDEMDVAFGNALSDKWKGLLDDDDDEQSNNIVSMQEDRNNHKPQKPLTGVCLGYTTDDSDSDSDSDSYSISATTTISSSETLSTCDSFGSSNHHHGIDLQESPNSTIELLSLTQEVSQGLGQETIKKKKTGFFSRMIQKFKKIHLSS